MIVDICAAVVALAVLSLSVYAIVALHAAKRSIEQAGASLAQLQSDLAELRAEAVELLHTVNGLSGSVRLKLQSLEPITASLQTAGTAARSAADAVASVSRTVAGKASEVRRAVERAETPLAELMNLALYGLQLWQDRRTSRETKPDSNE